jgi:hypothetical protein
MQQSHADSKDFKFIGYSDFSESISLRAFYISNDGKIIVRYANSDKLNPRWEKDYENENLYQVVQTFFENIFESVLGIK